MLPLQGSGADPEDVPGEILFSLELCADAPRSLGESTSLYIAGGHSAGAICCRTNQPPVSRRRRKHCPGKVMMRFHQSEAQPSAAMFWDLPTTAVPPSSLSQQSLPRQCLQAPASADNPAEGRGFPSRPRIKAPVFADSLAVADWGSALHQCVDSASPPGVLLLRLRLCTSNLPCGAGNDAAGRTEPQQHRAAGREAPDSIPRLWAGRAEPGQLLLGSLVCPG